MRQAYKLCLAMDKKSKVEMFSEFANNTFGIDLNPGTFERTYSGHWQRSAGAWSWWMYSFTSPHDYGSQWSITQLLNKKDYVSFGSREFYIEDFKRNPT